MTVSDLSTPDRRNTRPPEVDTHSKRAARHHSNASSYRGESNGRFIEYGGTVDEFLKEYARSATTYQPPDRDHMGAFNELEDTKLLKDEKDMYEPLINGFKSLCDDMDADKRPAFYDGASKQWRYPYKRWLCHHTFMAPDIVALPPGTTLADGEQPSEWKHACFVVEVKGTKHPDPITSNHEKAATHRIQIMRDAGHVMLATGLLCVFVVGIYGQDARIFRVDHAGAVSSRRFNYVQNPEVLRQFVWRFFNPTAGTPFIGVDNTIRPASAADVAWAKEVCVAADGRWDAEAEEELNRWVTVPSKGERSEQDYLLLRSIYVDPNTFCRATCVRQAVLKGDQSGKRYVVKDAWRQRARKHRETEFYERIEKYCEETGRAYEGIAKLANGVDLGQMMSQSLHKAQSLTCNVKKHHSPLHMRDRNHMRIVLQTVGIPLDRFPSTRVFIEAIRDAVKGHLLAFLAGVLHRDISKGNVLILLGDVPFKGFICDFDCSSFVDSTKFGGSRPDAYSSEDDPENELKDRTGTFRYFACELLDRSGPVLHRAHHDLESFYWVILWIILCHTDHDHPSGFAACNKVFGGATEEAASSQKFRWLGQNSQNLTIRGNKPLTDLMNALTSLVYASQRQRDTQHEPLTHAAFIEALDRALDAEGWPEDDKARPFVPPHVDDDGNIVQTGSKRNREAGDEGARSKKKQRVSVKDVAPLRSGRVDLASIKWVNSDPEPE
ncbi:uncharacterized protein C8Q71DRAFT_859563 [Rhodofomes roseus]|uniref:Protein kinase domain-containing protein n=1 Tax=Rhodofomes roseus TaxID=34475 RepID=A0ABQ8KAP8_9APHY|nr:uncharacterized protein C8Q71DRAFT_859563 [Rhodofomes roseus]KAH9834586.1 hypothetical protein C8Q71DRAFT_859563 [Rhodofomes roseus]